MSNLEEFIKECDEGIAKLKDVGINEMALAPMAVIEVNKSLAQALQAELKEIRELIK